MTPLTRQIANTILFVIMLGAGVGLSALVAGNTTLSLQICGAAGVICVILLIIGGVIVARSK